ncbi:MAG TPA: adenylosuccinate lyase [Rhodospirillales bacterium]|nr:adenylosuccinate lyase [Rhodospirillales bacterium]
MSAYVIDSELFGDQFSTPAMREIFSDRMTVQKWLDVEVALAHAEAAVGVVPAEAAEEIARIADVALYDLGELKREMDRTAHPIVPLVRAMAERCAGEAGQFVHWGATTQDITDTGMILQMKDAHATIHEVLGGLRGKLQVLAEAHRETPMVGRTHGQQAQPITFGYKVAVWMDEIARHLERLEQCAPRLFVGQFSGAVGTMAAIGDDGIEIQRHMMAALGLACPNISWHAARDTMAEYAMVVALAVGTVGKIAHEIIALQKTEVAELEEPMPEGKVGSSTMPHKRNPAICETIVALARCIRSAVPLALDGVIAEHERDKIGLQSEREYVARISCHAHAAITKAIYVTGGLKVRADNMRRNLDITKGILLSEAVMMKLGETLGRQRAHDIIYEACMAAAVEGSTMKEALARVPAVADTFSDAEIDALLAPEAYTGLAAAFADRIVKGKSLA